LITLRNGKMRCAALHGTCENTLTENSWECVFICQTGEIHDSRGRLLVRIGKVTVVRRPLQSMVCSGRLTICDQKFMVRARNRIRCRDEPPSRVVFMQLEAVATNSGYFGAIYQQPSRGGAIDGSACVGAHI
jgi:hypothetical protein